MTREEQIEKAGKECYNKHSHYYAYNDEDSITTAFEMGARWADENPINVWHPAIEEPQGPWHILCERFYVYDIPTIDLLIWYEVSDWDTYVERRYITRWAYISDLLPKGGKQ